VLDGSYEEVNGGRSHQCTASTTLFHAAGDEHLERFGGTGGRSLIVEIEPAWYGRVRELAPGGVSTSAADCGTLRLYGSRLYREFLTNDDSSRLIIEGLLMELSGEFLRLRRLVEARRPRWLGDVRDYLHANFGRRLTLENIGKVAKAHPVHVAQTFRRFHECTVGEYLRRLRVEFACRELMGSTKSISEVAVTAGFADQSHFHRAFRREMGMTPAQYRKQHRG
jgi:AraC family transcriptional regulator